MNCGGSMWLEIGIGIAAFLTYYFTKLFDLNIYLAIALFAMLILTIFQKS